MSEPLHSFCIVADDLSGAADCAASLARVAGPLPVLLRGPVAPGACVAIDTDSRAMELAAAVAATTRTFEQIARRRVAYDLVYKKIDSTLRGHVGGELAAALQAAPRFAAAVVAPAFPEQGRTLVGGQLRVQGQPPGQLGRGGDLMEMLHRSGLRPVLLSEPAADAAALAQRIHHALKAGARAIAVDAADQQDLARLAAALRELAAAPLLIAGSAGLARALAAHVEPGCAGGSAPEAAAPGGGAVLTVVGSFSRASAAQVDAVAQARTAHVIRLSAFQWLDDHHADFREEVLVRARRELSDGASVLLAISGEVVQPFSRSLVQAMARTAAPLAGEAAACVLTGGDTARAVFDALRIDRLDVGGEFEPGISTGRAAAQACTFVLKAGGFGDAQALHRAIRHFGPGGRQSTPGRRGAPG